MSWAAATEASHTGIKAEVKYLDDWINLLDKLIEEYPEFPWVEIEARVALTMHTAIVWRVPGHPKRDEWRKQLMNIWQEVTNPALFSEIGAYTVSHDMIIGNNTEAIQVLDTLKGFLSNRVYPLYLMKTQIFN